MLVLIHWNTDILISSDLSGKMLHVIARLLIHPTLGTRIQAIDQALAQVELKKDHPDVLWILDEEKLGVEAAKKIRQHLSLKPYSAQGRAVVVESADNFTVDAQNSLLKTLEEPPPEAIILLGADSDKKLLPTVLSRLQIVILNNKLPNSPSPLMGEGRGEGLKGEIEKLLSSSTEERFEYIEKLEDKETFFHGLLAFFHAKLKSEPKYLDFTKELLKAEEWYAANGNLRAILEYLILKMPN